MNESAWTPIAHSDNLNATFDGNGYEISNITINGSYKNAGLFGSIHKVKNLGVRNVYIKNTASGGNTGAIAGLVSGSIENCYVTGSGRVSGCFQTGGIVGQLNYGMISCYVNNIDVVGSGSGTGGLAGDFGSSARIEYSYFNGTVIAGSGPAGVFFGNYSQPGIKNSYSTGTIMYGGTAVDGYFVNSLGVATTEGLHDNSFYKNSSGQYIFNGSTVSSMPYKL